MITCHVPFWYCGTACQFSYVFVELCVIAQAHMSYVYHIDECHNGTVCHFPGYVFARRAMSKNTVA